MSIDGPQTLRLADGRFVRLAEIWVPPAGATEFDASKAAKNYLREAALGRKVEVKFGGTQRDRYGIYLAHVFVAGDRPVWLQEGLVESGLALVFPQADNHACAERLLRAETNARGEKRGYWGLAYFKVLEARDPRSILNLIQTYQIVEGKVDRATESGGRITSFFDAGRGTGFAAVIQPAVKKRFADKQKPENWTGVQLRVRGWIDRKRGPYISVTQPEQVEFLNLDRSPPEEATPRK